MQPIPVHQDAEKALEHGVNGIVVSNHGNLFHYT